jgi:hypothetical protein
MRPDGDIIRKDYGVYWIHLAQLMVTSSGLEKVCCRLRSSAGLRKEQQWNVAVAKVGHFRRAGRHVHLVDRTGVQVYRCTGTVRPEHTATCGIRVTEMRRDE